MHKPLAQAVIPWALRLMWQAQGKKGPSFDKACWPGGCAHRLLRRVHQCVPQPTSLTHLYPLSCCRLPQSRWEAAEMLLVVITWLLTCQCHVMGLGVVGLGLGV